MPYTFVDAELVAELYNSEWYKISDIKELSRAMGRTDYSVVDARRNAHKVINELRDDAVNAPFDNNTRFPDDLKEFYLTDHNSAVAMVIIGLQNCLSYRLGNVAKDTEVGSSSQATAPRGKDDKSVVLAFDQGTQDNIKRFEELQKQLNELCNNKDLLIGRRRFETKYRATWA
jgi:hypothetical protein